MVDGVVGEFFWLSIAVTSSGVHVVCWGDAVGPVMWTIVLFCAGVGLDVLGTAMAGPAGMAAARGGREAMTRGLSNLFRRQKPFTDAQRIDPVLFQMERNIS
jgi:hypothetical protein